MYGLIESTAIVYIANGIHNAIIPTNETHTLITHYTACTPEAI